MALTPLDWIPIYRKSSRSASKPLTQLTSPAPPRPTSFTTMSCQMYDVASSNFWKQRVMKEDIAKHQASTNPITGVKTSFPGPLKAAPASRGPSRPASVVASERAAPADDAREFGGLRALPGVLRVAHLQPRTICPGCCSGVLRVAVAVIRRDDLLLSYSHLSPSTPHLPAT